MKRLNYFSLAVVTGLLAIGVLNADDINPGVMSPNSGTPGVIVPGNDMQPNPQPLAPPQLPPDSYTQPSTGASSGTATTTDGSSTTMSPVTTPAPYVAGPAASPANNPMMQKCRVLDRNGNGLIKAYMADSGPSLEGDASAWIWVPYGQCSKINQGDFSGVSAEIRGKINPSNISDAQTIN